MIGAALAPRAVLVTLLAGDNFNQGVCIGRQLPQKVVESHNADQLAVFGHDWHTTTSWAFMRSTAWAASSESRAMTVGPRIMSRTVRVCGSSPLLSTSTTMSRSVTIPIGVWSSGSLTIDEITDVLLPHEPAGVEYA